MLKDRAGALKTAPRILWTRPFRETFFGCISRNPISLRFVTPFVGYVPGYGTLFDFARYFLRDEDVTLQITTRPPSKAAETLSRDEAEALQNLGVDLIVRSKPPLHSKVYQFIFREGDSAAFVGSANFTKGGLKRNDETIAYFRDSKDNKRVELELDRLTGWGSVPFAQWAAVKDTLKGD